MNRYKKFFLISLLFFPGLLSAETYNVGAVLILTSDQAVYGIAMQHGIDIGLKECNQKLKKKDTEVKVIYEDSALRPKQAHSAAMKLITQDNIIAGINSSFAEVMANGKLFENKKIPAITLWDSSEQIEKLGDYNLAIGLWTPSAAEVSSEFAYKTLKARTAVVINTEGEWSETVATLFKKNFEKSGGQVLDTFSVNHDNDDFRAILTRTKFKNPDVIYAPLMEDMIAFYKQLRQLNIKSPIISSDIIAKEHIDQIPDLLEGVYQSSAPALSGKQADLMRTKYKSHFDEEPSLPLFSAWGYDGIMLLCEAIDHGAKSSEEIKRFLYQVKDFPGLSNTINFTAKGSSPLNEKMYQVQEGKFILLSD